MRVFVAIVAALCSASALGQGLPALKSQRGAGSREVFFAPLSASGLTTTMPTGIHSPTVVWLGSDPLVNQVTPSETFSAVGAPSLVGAPYCPGGDYDGVDEGDGRCLGARRFNGSSMAYNGGDNGDADDVISVCALARPTAVATGASQVIVAKRVNGGTNDGWSLGYSSTAVISFNIDADASAAATKSTAPTVTAGWAVVCGTASVANGTYAYLNGLPGANVAYPARTGGGPANAANLYISSGPVGDGSFGLNGDVAAVWIWEGTELSASQVKTFGQSVMGVLGSRGEQATFTNTGPVGVWMDGAISVFSDDHPILGAEIPPGATGAGAASSGYFAHPGVTNSLLQSRVLNVTWTEIGAAVVATSTAASFFRDARQLYKITDNDAGSSEGITQTVAKGAATAVAIVVEAVTEAGAGALTIGVQETTGACGTAPAETLATSCTTGVAATTCTYLKAFADATCTHFAVNLYPVDVAGGGVAATGHAALVAQAFLTLTYAPPIYLETTSAAVTGGVDSLRYTVTGGPVVSATGTIVGTERFAWNWVPFVSQLPSGTPTLLRLDDGTATQRLLIVPTTSETFIYIVTPGGTDFTSAATTWVAGTAQKHILSLNYDRDVYAYSVDGVLLGAWTTARASPTGLTTLWLGDAGSNNQAAGGTTTFNVRVSR